MASTSMFCHRQTGSTHGAANHAAIRMGINTTMVAIVLVLVFVPLAMGGTITAWVRTTREWSTAAAPVGMRHTYPIMQNARND